MDQQEELITLVLRRVEKEADGCWIWTGSVSSWGYGQIQYQKVHYKPHRLAYLHFVGPLESGNHIHHLCGNKRCCNPEHLQQVPAREHVLLGNTIARKNKLATHCIHGHAFTFTNTYTTPNGRRMCRRCNAIRSAAYDQRKR